MHLLSIIWKMVLNSQAHLTLWLAIRRHPRSRQWKIWVCRPDFRSRRMKCTERLTWLTVQYVACELECVAYYLKVILLLLQFSMTSYEISQYLVFTHEGPVSGYNIFICIFHRVDSTRRFKLYYSWRAQGATQIIMERSYATGDRLVYRYCSVEYDHE